MLLTPIPPRHVSIPCCQKRCATGGRMLKTANNDAHMNVRHLTFPVLFHDSRGCISTGIVPVLPRPLFKTHGRSSYMLIKCSETSDSLFSISRTVGLFLAQMLQFWGEISGRCPGRAFAARKVISSSIFTGKYNLSSSCCRN